jgi:hypothetical protein
MMNHPQPVLQFKNSSRLKTPTEVAAYAADLILELRNLSRGAGLKTLQGLLEVAYYEAFTMANPVVLDAEESALLKTLERVSRQS